MPDKQRRAMFRNINNPKTKRSKRPKVTVQGKPQGKKLLSNDIRTVSGSENVKVTESFNEKENRRSYQNNTIFLEDKDTNIQVTVIDRQNSLKPKKARFITAEEIQGDFVITEFDSNKRKVAELHVIPSNIEPINLQRSETQTQKRIKEFKSELRNPNLTNAQIANKSDLTLIREIAKNEFGIKQKSRVKNERLSLVRQIRKKELQKSENSKNIKLKPEPESNVVKFGDITKIKR